MSEEQTEQVEAVEASAVDEQAEPASAEQADTSEEKPPWGSDDEFDPERAWRLIQNLRKEKEDLKPLADKAKELEKEQMSEQEKLVAERDELRSEQQRLAGETTALRVALRYGLTEEDLDLIGSDNEEKIEQRAKRLAELRTSSNASQRPEPKLAPTSVGGDAEPDGDELVKRIRQRQGRVI